MLTLSVLWHTCASQYRKLLSAADSDPHVPGSIAQHLDEQQSSDLCLQMSNRRCLTNRAAAAAAAGHSGAQLAVLGEEAVGAEVEVWWPLDEDWYRGTVSGFEALRQRHTVCYSDGDVEIIPLWAPNQMVSLIGLLEY